jgi:transcriptional regulator with XRE-family HTH domain
MRYDFRIIQEAINERGMTFRKIEDATGIDYTTVSRVLKTGRARPSTALALTAFFRVPMKKVQVRRKRVA